MAPREEVKGRLPFPYRRRKFPSQAKGRQESYGLPTNDDDDDDDDDD